MLAISAQLVECGSCNLFEHRRVRERLYISPSVPWEITRAEHDCVARDFTILLRTQWKAYNGGRANRTCCSQRLPFPSRGYVPPLACALMPSVHQIPTLSDAIDIPGGDCIAQRLYRCVSTIAELLWDLPCRMLARLVCMWDESAPLEQRSR